MDLYGLSIKPDGHANLIAGSAFHWAYIQRIPPAFSWITIQSKLEPIPLSSGKCILLYSKRGFSIEGRKISQRNQEGYEYDTFHNRVLDKPVLDANFYHDELMAIYSGVPLVGRNPPHEGAEQKQLSLLQLTFAKRAASQT